MQDHIDLAAYSYRFVDFEQANIFQANCAVPITFRDYENLRHYHAAYRRKYIIPLSEVVDLCRDKKAFNEAIRQTAFAALIPPMLQRHDVQFPFVLKKRISEAGLDVHMIKDATDAAHYAEQIASDDYICQKYVPGAVEYATHMLMAGGKLYYHSTNEYRMGQDFIVKGDAVRPQQEAFGIEADAAIIEQLAGILRAIGYEGTCCFDYKLADGQIQLLELNPRCGSSLFREINLYLAAYHEALRRP